jgi:uncharacterized protein YbaP (TraB family)
MQTPRNNWRMRLAVLAAVIVAVFFVVFGARGAQAPAVQPAPEAERREGGPALWVVRDRDTTIWLFGTFHIMDESEDWFAGEIKDAFDGSQELVLEADIPIDAAALAARTQPLIRRYAVDPQGRTISARLTAEQNRVLDAALETVGVRPGSYDRMEPWFINMNLARALGRRAGAGIEGGAETVLRRAAGRRMRFRALETMEDQFRLFDGLPEEGQLAQLRTMLDNWEAIGTQLPRMLSVWKRGDAELLDRILNAGLRQDPGLRRALLEDRNRAWAAWVARRLERPGTVFMAVGAGHLVGADSVQSLLRERGIEAARVPTGEARRTWPPCRRRSDDRCVQRR